ncbi:MAG TPA: energy transducer TonB [Bacteroidia bacterium]|jgi:TonB family protein|nr:energy transducer TonB [Bacteroidia bacterium]
MTNFLMKLLSLILFILYCSQPLFSQTKQTDPPKPDCIDCDLDETQPEFPGGNKALCEFIVKQTHYPPGEIDKNREGKVFVRFKITETGTITEVTILRGVSPGLDQEVIRMIQSMPKWKPATSHKKKVAVMHILPVQFKLSEGGKPNISQCDSWGK